MKTVTPKQLREWGLLFEINRRVLHPLGLALQMTTNEKGEEVFSDEIWDCREDPEGIYYEEDTFELGHEKLDRMMEEWGERKMQERYEALTFVLQMDGKDPFKD